MNANESEFNDEDYPSSGGHIHDQGYKNLTKREEFAKSILIGLVANSHISMVWPSDIPSKKRQELIVTTAIEIADCLIAELSKTESK